MHGEPLVGTDLLLLASSIGLALSSVTVLESRSGTKKIDGETTVLADVFHMPQPEPMHGTNIILKFLNSVPPQSTDHNTRIASLIDSWKSGHYLRTTKERHLEKLAVLQPQSERYRENIHLLSDRIRMLFDTQNAVQQLDIELLDLLRVAEVN